MADELNPAETSAATAADPEAEPEEPIKKRKNGLYPGVSDELADSMKSGWADTELHDLQPVEQAEHTARRRRRRAPRASRASAW